MIAPARSNDSMYRVMTRAESHDFHEDRPRRIDDSSIMLGAYPNHTEAERRAAPFRLWRTEEWFQIWSSVDLQIVIVPE